MNPERSTAITGGGARIARTRSAIRKATIAAIMRNRQLGHGSLNRREVSPGQGNAVAAYTARRYPAGRRRQKCQ